MKLLGAIMFCLVYLSLLCHAQDSRVADYYLSNPEKYEGKKITVACSSVTRESEPIKDGDARIAFVAYTCSRGIDSKGAYILVLVAPGDAAAFAKKYGFVGEFDSQGNYRTRPLSGIFKHEGDHYFIEYSPSK